VQFRLLGPLEVTGDDGPIALGGTKQRTVLALLLLRANALVPAERLIDEVWADDPPAAVRNVLQSYVSRLRKALGAERLEHRPGGYVMHADADEIDVRCFEALVDEGRARSATDPESAVHTLRRADALWRGRALDDLADQPSLRADIARLEELRVAAAEARVVAELALGRHAELVPELEALTARHPLREGLWAHLMTALYRSGRKADALAVYRRARSALVEELGLEPSAELRRLEQQVLQQDPALDVTGRRLRGYRLLERVGEGSFGVVHRALQPQVDREVAVKVIRPGLANDPEFIRRFEAEARLVARLEHPRIVPLYDYWREPDGAFLVMRFLRGGSLREALAGGPFPLERALGVVEHVAAALASAHRQGVVHRDVKPANVLLDQEGNAYLSDFGIARDVARARTPERVTTGGSSAYYLSPEEGRGEVPTARADVYSLGLVLFEMLAGRHPFAGVSAAEVDAARPVVPPLDGHSPRGVQELVRRATMDDPAERYPDASALLAALGTTTATAHAAARALAAPAGPVRNPYKGLRPFLEADAADFHGRDRLVRHLVDRVAADRLLALIGPSGSGKSSVVRAGVVPAVRAGGVPGSARWFVAEMVPGPDPFATLAEALGGVATVALSPDLAERLERDEGALRDAVARLLPDDDAELLLVIDQLEELFTLGDQNRQARFMAALAASVSDPRSRVRIVLTLRADLLDRPLSQSGFAEILRTGTELIVPLGVDELEEAISAPASRVGVRVEPGLLAALVADVVGQPGALPLLQFTLAELFDRRTGGILTAAAYQELGGVAGAVARGAEDIFGALGDSGGEAARQLFLRLVGPGEGVQVVGRRVRRSELLSMTGDAAAMESAIDRFTQRRLLSLDRDPETRESTVEIAHEALLSAWHRLRDWVTEAQEDLRTQRQLAAAATEWQNAARDPSFLLRGSRLERLEAWRTDSALALTPGEREFLDASLAERDCLHAEEATRHARERELERRSLRRLRGLVAVLAAAGLVAGGLTVYAFDQRDDADRERRTAVARGLAAAAVASLDDDAERSVLLSREAVEHTRRVDGTVLPESIEALHRAVLASRIVLRVPGLGGALDWSPDGALFVTEGPEETGLIDIRDARTGRSVRSFPGHAADVNLVAFSPDGARLATSGDDGTVKLWDPRTGAQLDAFRGNGQDDQVWGLSFSPDGSRLAAVWLGEQTLRVWNLDTGRAVQETHVDSAALTTSFSQDGRRLAVARFDGGGTVVDLASGRRIMDLPGDRGVHDVDWSPDGRLIATAGLDGTVRIVDAATGRSRFSLTGHTGQVIAGDWSRDGRRLVTAGTDGKVKVWEVGPDGARELLSMTAQERGGGLWAAFSPDGEWVLTGDADITVVKVWDVGRDGSAEWANLPAEAGPIGGVAFTSDGASVVTSQHQGSLTLWDVQSGARSRVLRGPRPPERLFGVAVAASPRGAVTTTAGDLVRTWDVATGRESFVVRIPNVVDDIRWSADGAHLAMAGWDGVVRVVDQDGADVAVLRGAPGTRAAAVRFSPNGRLLAVAVVATDRPRPGANHVVLWDWRHQQVVRTLPAQAEGISFSSGGRLLATASMSGPVRIWDVRTGRVVTRLVAHSGAVYDVEFSPDGSVVATASADGTVRLWDPRTGRQELVLRGHDGEVWDVEFSPDGTKLASVSPEGTARVWALDLDDLLAIAERNVTRGLTAAECRQYLASSVCR
jgi:WD40 repeat protein/DNA-binding SARP family transcriptional activator